MDKWKICIDSDTATPIDLSELLDITLAVNVGIPTVKYSALSLTGYQGDLDLTEIYDNQIYYNPRECTVFIISEQGDINAIANINTFMSMFYGERVRLVNTTQNYMLIGRLTEAEMQSTATGGNYKLTCKLMAEPWRYETTETERGDIMPINTPSNQWATLTANKEHATSTGFSANAGELPLIQFPVTADGNQYYRIVFSNLSNCTVRVINHTTIGAYKSMIVDYNLPFIPKYDTLMVIVDPIDIEKPVSGSVYVGVYPATVIDYSGKPVAIKVAQTISDAHTDLYLLNNGVGAKLDYGSTYEEYPQLMLSTGANKLLVMASALDFDASTLGSTALINIKWREGNL